MNTDRSICPTCGRILTPRGMLAVAEGGKQRFFELLACTSGRCVGQETIEKFPKRQETERRRA